MIFTVKLMFFMAEAIADFAVVGIVARLVVPPGSFEARTFHLFQQRLASGQKGTAEL